MRRCLPPADISNLYKYRLTFDLSGLEPSMASITGQVASDNIGVIFLNDIALPFLSLGLTSFSSFSVNSGFVSGINNLDFLVNNTPAGFDTPAGLRVELSGSASVIHDVPEPATWVLLLVGVVGIGIRRG